MSLASEPIPLPWRGLLVCVCGLVLLVGACLRLGIDPTVLFTQRVIVAVRDVVMRMVPPRVDAETISHLTQGAIETLSMSVTGTVVGAVIALLLMPLCSEVVLVRGPLVDEESSSWSSKAAVWAIHHGARLGANVLRTIPYFAWALLFWFMVGPGVFAGALAIAVHTGGVLTRTYALAIDTVDLRPAHALRVIGGRRVHVLLYGLLPAARASLASLTFYRWEVNIRESAVLGLVGTAGLGFHLKYALGTFDWRSAATYLLGMIVIVLAVDAVSAIVRRQLV